jgi:hypothetical protein
MLWRRERCGYFSPSQFAARSDALRQGMTQALSDGTSALTDLRVAVRMKERTQVKKALAEVSKSLKTFNGLQRELQ